MILVDSHAHLEVEDDLDDVLDRAKESGVEKIITIGASLETSRKAIGIAEKYSSNNLQIYATAGIHPQDGKDDVKDGWIDKLKSIAASSSKIVGIGECGLDYYLPEEKRIETVDKDREFQRELFEAQIKLAADLNLPLVVHCRNGWDDVFRLLSTNNRQSTKINGVFHSWTGDWEAAQKALDLGFCISFSGIVTFKNAPAVQEVAKKAPINRILVETDSPFLSPEPNRGKKNEPKNVKIIAQFIAKVRNQPFDAFSAQTSQNAQKLFSLL